MRYGTYLPTYPPTVTYIIEGFFKSRETVPESFLYLKYCFHLIRLRGSGSVGPEPENRIRNHCYGSGNTTGEKCVVLDP